MKKQNNKSRFNYNQKLVKITVQQTLNYTMETFLFKKKTHDNRKFQQKKNLYLVNKSEKNGYRHVCMCVRACAGVCVCYK